MTKNKKFTEIAEKDQPQPLNSSFKERVYYWCKQIPKGKVATYGQLAKLAGNPRAARAVGRLMKNNPGAPDIPCHRVVAADGSLTGYSLKGGVFKKKRLLIKEGVKFKIKKINMEKSQW